ncbi:PREDICTED: cyclin N-terminal domain-containing protein 2 [Gekko japonicus]|uniref:Cyclin N-terminal domain-containing protein 2 n=1 Tax=Gekko japonicus TaxID=146911 RepID=A0ABM1JNV3_GEKJA|nr:PREDICTED: cyclin N-terminal domain-containing protein 2 [Gekko japonicus]
MAPSARATPRLWHRGPLEAQPAWLLTAGERTTLPGISLPGRGWSGPSWGRGSPAVVHADEDRMGPPRSLPPLLLSLPPVKGRGSQGGDGAPEEKPGAACPGDAAAAEAPPQRARPAGPPSRKAEERSRESGRPTHRPAALFSPAPSGVPLSASLGQELSQAMRRMDMGVEQEYAGDIFQSLMEQPRYTFRASDMPRAVTAERRALVVDWLVQVHEYLKLADDTLYLAVYLMNAYLKMSKVRVAALQLLSVACLFLACKVEESTCPQPSQLCLMTEDTVTPKELFCMERRILTRLRFELHYANPVSLLHLLAEVGRASLEVRHMAMYFMELSLMEADAVGVEPALLAVAALCLAQRVLGEGGSRSLQGDPPKLHMYSASELSAVYTSMARAATQSSGSPLRATFWKYSRPQKLCTSTSSALTDSAYLRRFQGSPTP